MSLFNINCTASLVATCLNNFELLETMGDHFLHNLSLLSEEHSTLRSDNSHSQEKWTYNIKKMLRRWTQTFYLFNEFTKVQV